MALPVRAQRVLRSLRYAIPTGVVLGRKSAGDGPAEFIPLSEIQQAQLDAISATRGAILYRGASGWAALPPGTAGQVLTSNGVGDDPEWSAGGGTAGFWWFDPPASADFPTTVTEGSASSTSVVEDADVGLALSALPGGNDSLYAILQAAPTPPFSVTAHFTVGQIGGLIAGIVLRASSTGLRTVFGADADSGFGGLIVRRATGTTFNANLAATTMRAFSYGLWIRVVVTSLTNVVYEFSGDGKNWVVWQSNTANGQVANLDQVGIGVTRRNTASLPSCISCDYFEVA